MSRRRRCVTVRCAGWWCAKTCVALLPVQRCIRCSIWRAGTSERARRTRLELTREGEITVKQLLTVAVLAAASGACAAAQAPVDYASLEIKTTDLGNGVYILNWQGGDS